MKRLMVFFLAVAIAGISGCTTEEPAAGPSVKGPHTFKPAEQSMPLVLYAVDVGTAESTIIKIPFAPGGAEEAKLTLTINDMDEQKEAKIFINGKGPVAPPEDLLSPADTLTADLKVNPKWFKKGPNEIKFIFADDLDGETQGFTVEEMALTLTFK